MLLNVLCENYTAKLPTQSYEGDLYDVYSNETVTVTSDKVTLISTGLIFDIPKGYHIEAYNRSGNPLKFSLILGNGVGQIDQNYRGELKGLFYTLPKKFGPFLINRKVKVEQGQKLFQIKLEKNIKTTINQTKIVTITDRGTNGFGSTN